MVELIARLVGKLHELKFGHYPNWFEMGEGQQVCMECVFKRSGGPRGGRQRNVWAPTRLGLTGARYSGTFHAS